jgi:hypothetical protein
MPCKTRRLAARDRPAPSAGKIVVDWQIANVITLLASQGRLAQDFSSRSNSSANCGLRTHDEPIERSTLEEREMQRLSRFAVTGFLVGLMGVALAASSPPPPPTDVVVSDITSLTYKRGSFILEFTPVAGHTKYQFSVAPKYCSFKNTTNGTGNFPTAVFTAPPYRVLVECNCKTTYTVAVATAPPDAYTTRSTWVKSLPFPIACAPR